MIKLKSFKFGNIRCFDSEQSITFEEYDKLVRVSGQVEETGGSSGAGKSTIFLALDYLLGVNDVPATVLQSWLTKDAMYAEGVFDIDNKEIIISRSKKNGLTIVSPEETVSGNVKLAEEKLDELIGIPRDVFKRMIHKKQKEGGFFLDMKASKVYEFLTHVLGLDPYLKKLEKISEDIKTSNEQLQQISQQTNSTHESIDELQTMLDSKVEPTCSVTQAEVDKLESSVKECESNLVSLKEELENTKKYVVKPELKTVNKDTGVLSEIQQEIKDSEFKLTKMKEKLQLFKDHISGISNMKQEAKRYGADITKLRSEKKSIEKSICPTCKQEWVGSSAKEQVKKIDLKINDLTKSALNLKEQIDKESEYSSNIEKLEPIIKETEQQIQHLRGKESDEKARLTSLDKEVENENLRLEKDYEAKIRQIDEKYSSNIKDLENKLNTLKSDLSNKKTILNSYSESMENYKQEVKKIQSLIEEKKCKYNEFTERYKTLENRVQVAEESKRLMKSYVLQTFQETLDLIGDMATDILSSVPNMASSTVYFEGCKETKSGSIKEEVNAIINMDGNNAIPIKALSGGQRTTIDLAVDLAVIDVIEAKVGKGVNFFVIDEPFDGLDSVCKESYLEILTKIDTNKKIIMVDHSPELQEMVSDTINVVQSGESSRIV